RTAEKRREEKRREEKRIYRRGRRGRRGRKEKSSPRGTQGKRGEEFTAGDAGDAGKTDRGRDEDFGAAHEQARRPRSAALPSGAIVESRSRVRGDSDVSRFSILRFSA